MYVTMIDNFMSGWGEARDLTNIYLIECDNAEQADQIFNHANNRPEMRKVKICHDEPRYAESTHLVTHKFYSEVGGCWIKEGGRIRGIFNMVNEFMEKVRKEWYEPAGEVGDIETIKWCEDVFSGVIPQSVAEVFMGEWDHLADDTRQDGSPYPTGFDKIDE